MAVTATRSITIVYSGAVTGTQVIEAASNAASPGYLEVKTLSSGANTITIPTGGATTVACTIVPPVGNTTQITLKGVSGDTGIAIHDTDPTTIALDSTQTTFVLNAATSLTGVRFYWN